MLKVIIKKVIRILVFLMLILNVTFVYSKGNETDLNNMLEVNDVDNANVNDELNNIIEVNNVNDKEIYVEEKKENSENDKLKNERDDVDERTNIDDEEKLDCKKLNESENTSEQIEDEKEVIDIEKVENENEGNEVNKENEKLENVEVINECKEEKINEENLNDDIINDKASSSDADFCIDNTEFENKKVNAEEVNDNMHVFGAGGVEHILTNTWAVDGMVDMYMAKKITIQKGGAEPSESGISSYDIDGMGLKVFVTSDRREVTIYTANEDDIIYTAEDASYLFAGGSFSGEKFTQLISINGFQNLNTSRTKNFRDMFYQCIKLTDIDLSNIDTSNAEYMESMFSQCKSLTNIDVSNFDTSNLQNLQYLFWDCESLVSLDVSNFDTKKVTGMMNLFSGCKSLTEIDISNFDTPLLIDTRGMFQEMSALTTIIASDKFDVSGVFLSGDMFYGCDNLVGQNGTRLSDFSGSAKTDKTHACIDTMSTPGYFSTHKFEVTFDMQGHGVQVAT